MSVIAATIVVGGELQSGSVVGRILELAQRVLQSKSEELVKVVLCCGVRRREHTESDR